ncbi:hypothetical protein, partial [Streptomyces sp. NPDC006638]|uniref:hypothetical protein n=1 Tax=Streptomyces sp. NPDC006638 TaxID=3157183 RepID=UPI0033B1BF78
VAALASGTPAADELAELYRSPMDSTAIRRCKRENPLREFSNRQEKRFALFLFTLRVNIFSFRFAPERKRTIPAAGIGDFRFASIPIPATPESLATGQVTGVVEPVTVHQTACWVGSLMDRHHRPGADPALPRRHEDEPG